MKRLALLLSVLFLLPVASAHADPFTPEVETYYASAIQYWGHEPTLCTTITKEVRDGSLEESDGLPVIGLGTQPIAEKGREACFITVDAIVEPWQLCRIVRHEVGHLEGFGHSGDPTNIMYPYITREQVAPGCPEPPPAPAGYEPHPFIQDLMASYNNWQYRVARCHMMATKVSHRRATLCWETARVYRWEYEEVSSSY